MSPRAAAWPATIDAYLANLSPARRAALEKLRRTIQFRVVQPHPPVRVRKLVKSRIAENAAKRERPGRRGGRRRRQPR